jgi:hypothetical protein
MWTNLGMVFQRMFFALLLAGSLGTAAFAYSSTAYATAERSGCCFWIGDCFSGMGCSDDDECVGSWCCPVCPP